jgi:hypothetical protein
MRAALALCAAALAVRAARGSVADAALELLRSGEAAALHPELAWCGGQVGLPGGAREKGGPPYAAVHVALRPSSFPDVELLNLTLGVRGWRAAAGHVAVVTARSDAEYTLHSGTPREVGPGEITLALTNAPPVRAGRTLLTVRLIGGASVATVPQSAGASGLGSVDDGGMGIVLAACESEKGALAPCRPARLLVRYDAECAKPPKVRRCLTQGKKESRPPEV